MTPDDENLLRRIIREELDRRLGVFGNCGRGCALGKNCRNENCIWPVVPPGIERPE